MYGASTATNSSSSSGSSSGSHYTTGGGAAAGDDTSHPHLLSTDSTARGGMNHSHDYSSSMGTPVGSGGYYGETTTSDGSIDSNNEEVSLDAINEHLNRYGRTH